MRMEKGTVFLSQVEEKKDNQDIDVFLLEESDIPGASLNGKSPSELDVTQLKRWLACRGAPVNGKKPELINRQVIYLFVITFL